MSGGRCERGAAQHHLIDHELAVVLAERAGRRPDSPDRRIGAAGPLPDDAEGVVERAGTRRDLPFGFGRQILAGPARESIGLVIADMTNRLRRIDRRRPPSVIANQAPSTLAPIARRVPAFAPRPSPSRPTATSVGVA